MWEGCLLNKTLNLPLSHERQQIVASRKLKLHKRGDLEHMVRELTWKEQAPIDECETKLKFNVRNMERRGGKKQ